MTNIELCSVYVLRVDCTNLIQKYFDLQDRLLYYNILFWIHTWVFFDTPGTVFALLSCVWYILKEDIPCAFPRVPVRRFWVVLWLVGIFCSTGSLSTRKTTKWCRVVQVRTAIACALTRASFQDQPSAAYPSLYRSTSYKLVRLYVYAAQLTDATTVLVSNALYLFKARVKSVPVLGFQLPRVHQ